MNNATIITSLVIYLIALSMILALTFPTSFIQEISIGQLNLESKSNSTDFRTYTNLSDLNIEIIDGIWALDSVKGLYSVDDVSGWWLFQTKAVNKLIFTDVKSITDEGIFNNTYHILNPDHNQIVVLLKHDKWTGEAGVLINEEGITFEDHFVEYNILELDDFVITTYLDTVTGHGIVYIDGVSIFDIHDNHLKSYSSTATAGLTAFGANVSIISFNNYLTPLSVNEDAFSIFNFISIISKILVWSVPSEILPVGINILFVKTPLIALIFIMIQTIRGVGG